MMRVLIAEDDPISSRVLRTMLEKWGYDVTVTCDGSQAWDALAAADAPRLAILDWMMPGVDGVEVVQRVRRLERRDYTYVILLTAKDRQEDIIAGMNSGADDYIVKPFDSGELKVRLRAAQRILDLQAKLLAAQEALHVQATHDGLTSAWNRRAIMDLLEDELHRASREEHTLGVIMGDLDRFKSINDTFGHAAGDAVLCEAVRRMKAVLRPYDHLGRYGGEEFLIVLPGCNGAEADALGERVRAAVAAGPLSCNETPISFTISLGVATTEAFGLIDAESLVHLADEAMYCAKRSGGDQSQNARKADGASAAATA